MEAIETLRRTIHVTRELQSLVKTMKVLAGLNIRHCERAVHAIAEYNRTIEMGLQIALPQAPETLLRPQHIPSPKLGVIVFGSDQGMCGQLNDVVVQHSSRAVARLARRRPELSVIAVGDRAAVQLENLGLRVEARLDVPGAVGGIGTVVHETLVRVEDWRRRGFEMVVLFYCRLVTGLFYRPCGMQLLPLDRDWIRSLQSKRWPSKVIPTYFMDTERLFHSLIREYLFVSIFRAYAESLASENAARLASMQIAERNIEDRLKALISEFHQSRQDAITSELLDIISGFEALKDQIAR